MFKNSHAHIQFTNNIYAEFQTDCLYTLEELITQTCYPALKSCLKIVSVKKCCNFVNLFLTILRLGFNMG